MFELMERDDFEEVVFFQDARTGLKAIVAIHDTTLGPALGGTRIWSYKNEVDALRDVLRLAKAMTLKSAAAGLNFGGGKAVIIGDPKKIKNEVLLRSYGRFIQSLGGRFITGEDVGTTVGDIRIIKTETDYVSGVKLDPSPFTAYGVYHGIKACLEYVFGDDCLDGVHVAVQGLGKVGSELVRLLIESGAKVTVTDIDEERVKACLEMGAEYVEPSRIYSVECDVFSPCALGGVINDSTIKRLRCRIVAGAANNQLESEKHGDMLANLGILYAPDYIINAGGLITVAHEYQCTNQYKEVDTEMLLKEIEQIGSRLKEIFRISENILDSSGRQVSTHKAAEIWAMERIEKLGGMKKMFIPQ
jgi:leucine dehydrogenase